MQRIALVPVLLAALVFSFFLTPNGEASDQWPMYQANPSHTGYIPVTLDPSKFTLRWQKKLGTLKLNPVTAAAGKVFVSESGYFDEASLYTLESKSGNLLWSKDFGKIFSVNPPSYYEGKVYVQTVNNSDDTCLASYDAESGDLVFRSSHDAQWEHYFSPTIYKGSVYVDGGYSGGMYAFDRENGTHEWFLDLPQYDEWTPAVDENLVYAYLGAQGSAATETLFVADRLTGQIVFTISGPDFDFTNYHMQLATVLGGLSDAFVIRKGWLIRFDLDARKIGWVHAGDYSGQPAVFNGIVYAAQGCVLGAYDQETGTLLWTWEVPDGKSLEDNIIVTDSHLFARTDGITYCISLADQDSVWSYPAAGHLSLGESALYIAATDGTLTAISLGLPDLYATESVVFDRANPGETVTRSVNIRNVGDEPLEVQSILSSSNVFVIQEPALPFVLGAHQSVSVDVAFTLTDGGEKRGTLSITSTDPNEPVISVALTGRSNDIHTLTASTSPGGTITPSGSIPILDGDSAYFSISPDAAFKISSVLVDGVPIGNPTRYRIDNVTADHSITVQFVPKPYYTISTSVNAGGLITPAGPTSVMEGQSLSIRISPEVGYGICDVLVDGKSVGIKSYYYFDNVQSNHVIAAVFCPKTQYTIDASAGAGGQISPTGQVLVYQGDNQSFSINPNKGFKISYILVDGLSIGAWSYYSFAAISANHTISAVFTAKPAYQINASAGEGGQISPSGEVITYQGDTEYFDITPDKGFQISSVLVDGVAVAITSRYVFRNITTSHSITATFSPKPAYHINASASEGGQISPSGEVVTYQGDIETFTITPYEGFAISDVIVDGSSVGVKYQYTFSSITSDHSISVVFAARQKYYVNASAGPEGKIYPSGQITAYQGDFQFFYITPNDGFKVLDLIIDGVSVGSQDYYYFQNITSNHSIVAIFGARQTYEITASAGIGGKIDPPGKVSIVEGYPQTFTITPNLGFDILDVIVDGVSQGAWAGYWFDGVQANHSIIAVFRAKAPYTIYASAEPGGHISPSGEVSVLEGQARTFTITPDTHHKISDVLVDGASVGAISEYTFENVTTAHTIAAVFSLLPQYSITASAGTGGQISPAGQVGVYQGESKGFTITPATHYMISDVLVDGASVGAKSEYAFENVTAAHTIAAVFSLLPQYSITASAGTGGLISPAGQVGVYQGESKSFTITPATHYMVSDLLVDGVSVGAKSQYTFENVSAGHTIAAVFSLLPQYSITASAGTGGLISPSGQVSVYEGDSQSFTIAPATHYVISDVLVDGVSAGAKSTYAFDNVTADHTIAAVFATAPQYSITASAGNGGQISPAGSVSVYEGDSRTFTITPYPYFYISDVLVDGVSVGIKSTYALDNVTRNHAIEAVFTAEPEYLITATSGTGGRINPSGQVNAHRGASQSFTITPNAGFKIGEVLVDGVSVGSPSSYDISNITGAHSISVSFKRDTDYFGIQAGNSQTLTRTYTTGRVARGSLTIAALQGSGEQSVYAVTNTAGTQKTVLVLKGSAELGITRIQTSESTAVFATPLITLKNPLRAGQTWKTRSAVSTGSGSGNATLTATVSARTLMNVSAGYFQAFPINYTLTMKIGAARTTSTWTEYFVPYIGTVKTVESDSTTVVKKFAVNAGTVNTPPPIVTGTNVPSAVPGSRIKIRGYQFGSQQGGGSVTIGGVKVNTVLSWTEQAIKCVVPEGAASGPVVVYSDAWDSSWNSSNGVRVKVQ